jgi:hypothetical protein
MVPQQEEDRSLILRAVDAAILAQHRLFTARLAHACAGESPDDRELHEAILESKEALDKVRSALGGHGGGCSTS